MRRNAASGSLVHERPASSTLSSASQGPMIDSAAITNTTASAARIPQTSGRGRLRLRSPRPAAAGATSAPALAAGLERAGEAQERERRRPQARRTPRTSRRWRARRSRRTPSPPRPRPRRRSCAALRVAMTIPVKAAPIAIRSSRAPISPVSERIMHLDAVRVARRLGAEPALQVVGAEVVDPDADQRVLRERVHRDAVEVVAVRTEPAGQAARARELVVVALLERRPAVGDELDRVAEQRRWRRSRRRPRRRSRRRR